MAKKKYIKKCIRVVEEAPLPKQTKKIVIFIPIPLQCEDKTTNYCIKNEFNDNRVVNNNIWTVNVKGGLSTI